MTRSLSVVVPAYREAAGIVATVQTIRAFAAARGLALEVLVADDGSDDGTADRVRDAKWSDVVVLQGAHAGKGAAVRRGVLAARHELVLVTDADLSVPLAHFDDLDAALANGADVAIGSKYVPGHRAAYPWLRRCGSWLARLAIRAVAVRGLHDTQCGFKLFRRDAARALFACQRLTGFGYDFEILFLARRFGLRIAELPVAVVHRADSRVRFASYGRTFGDLLQLLGNRLRGRYPRRPPL